MKESSFQFSNPTLSKLNFTVNPSFSFDENDDGIAFTTECHTKVVRNGELEAAVALELIIDTTQPGDGPFKIEAEIVSQFAWPSGVFSKEQIELLLSQNAPAVLLSYLRPIVSFITAQANLPPYQIPFMNFTEE